MSVKIYPVGKLSKLWRHFLKNPLSEEIADFVADQPNLILRELKQHFVASDDFAKVLEQAIDLQVIKRDNRRYSINLTQNLAIQSEVADNLITLKKEFSDLPNLMFQATLVSILRQKITPVVTDPPLLTDLWWVNEENFGNPLFDYYFVEQPYGDFFSWPKFFKKLDWEEKLTALETEILDLLGDLAPDYAFQQFNLTLAKFIDQKIVKISSIDIFDQALLKLGWLEAIDQDHYSCSLKLEKQDSTIDFRKNLLRTKFQDQFAESDYLSILLELSKWLGSADYQLAVYYQ